MSEPVGEQEVVVAGRYAVERELGRGGSAIVYLARDREDPRDDARVALKLLHQEFSGSKAAERFALEVRLLREFAHPNILSVTDAGEWDGRPFYVMPYVDGESLQGRLKRERRLPFDEVVRIGQRLCEALAYAHARKVVHRDVKPANVMLAGDAVYLTDFGVAKALEPIDGAPHSTTGVARGTRAYMSPEQVVADRDLDHRSDIFSLGCVLYEMIAGVRPFYSADEGRELMRRLVEGPDPLSRHRDGVPEGLERVVMKALAREPADRWGSVGEVGVGLGGEGRRPLVPAPLIRRRLGALAVGIAVVALVMSTVPRLTASNCRIAEVALQERPRIVMLASLDTLGSSDEAAATARSASRAAVARWRDAFLIDVREADPWGERERLRCIASNHDGALLVASRATSSPEGDSTRLEVRVVGDTFERESSRIVPRAMAADPGQWALLLRDALDQRVATGGLLGSDSSSTTFRAWRACRQGWRALESGIVDSADALFAGAIRADDRYPCAFLGRTVAASLRDRRSTEEGLSFVRRAQALRHEWSSPERAVLSALGASAESRFAVACPILSTLARERESDFVLQTLAADCLSSDSTVVRLADGSLAYQSSWMEAQRMLLRALVHSPVGFHVVVMPRLQRVAPTFPMVRWGWEPGKATASFGAYPSRESDTLAFHPTPRGRIERSEVGAVPRTLSEALRQSKRLHSSVAARWAQQAPESGAARFAYAVALEFLGRLEKDSVSGDGALQELRRAAIARHDPVPPSSLIEARVRTLLKLGRLQEVANVVDSALSNPTPGDGEQARVLGALAALTGRVEHAVRLWGQVIARDVAIPISVGARRELSQYTVFASMGCCLGLVDSLERTLTSRFNVEVEEESRPRLRDRLLGRSMSLIAACRGWRSILSVRDTTDKITRVHKAMARQDAATARLELKRLRRERAQFNAGDIAVDYVLQEALVSLALEDSAQARQDVESWLQALPINGALELREISQAGAIPRLLSLASLVGARLPDSWNGIGSPAQAVALLLRRSSPDDSLHFAGSSRDRTLCKVPYNRVEVGT